MTISVPAMFRESTVPCSTTDRRSASVKEVSTTAAAASSSMFRRIVLRTGVQSGTGSHNVGLFSAPRCTFRDGRGVGGTPRGYSTSYEDGAHLPSPGRYSRHWPDE